MNVVFRRTGERRYAVIIRVAGQPEQALDPAPGFDPHIPHDLVHYVVEAELELRSGVFGRAASGAGTFILQREGAMSAREQARARRKQARREQARAREPAAEAQMVASERLAYLADIVWRRQHGQRADPAFWHQETPLTPEDAERVERVVDRLRALSPQWNALPPGGELVFEWPSLRPEVRVPERPGAPSAGG